MITGASFVPVPNESIGRGRFLFRFSSSSFNLSVLYLRHLLNPELHIPDETKALMMNHSVPQAPHFAFPDPEQNNCNKFINAL